jgi:hypothetical protein
VKKEKGDPVDDQALQLPMPLENSNALSDKELLSTLREAFGFKCDQDVALILGCPRQHVGQINKGVRSLTAYQKLVIYDRMGYAWARDAILALFPDKTTERLRELDNERTRKNIRDKTCEKEQ